MMTGKKIEEENGLPLLLILIALLLYCLTRISLGPETIMDNKEYDVFLQISGEVKNPGVYGFSRPPSLDELMERAGAEQGKKGNPVISQSKVFDSGARIEIVREGRKIRVACNEMSAFYKMTLGIPLALNKETAEGLTALPGIGPKTAEAIVHERGKRGGFRVRTDLLSVRGIGPRKYADIEQFLMF